MKIIFLFLTFLLSTFTYAQVGINTSSPNNSAALDISSTDRGILIPRLTTVNRTAMANVQGMLVYDSDLNHFYYNNGSIWIRIQDSSTSTQAGTFNVGSTSNGWNYYNIIFATPFTVIPSISLTFREGTGIDNSGSNSIEQIKVANASATGFTIAINDDSVTSDAFVDWIATPRTQ